MKTFLYIIAFLVLDAFLFLFVHWFSFKEILICDTIVIDAISTSICSILFINFIAKKLKED
ncbi:hypothetical protein C4565_01840 [Candidatus Parcubacteria bacterium]|nr:MAG: hypothetical protein C4565_01840 [Candidatus Parcubacteria bacterium]